MHGYLFQGVILHAHVLLFSLIFIFFKGYFLSRTLR